MFDSPQNPESDKAKPIFLSPPSMLGGERELLLEAFDSNWIAPAGPQLGEFEKAVSKKIGVSHAIAVTSGTAAIHLSLASLGLSEGDTVITSSFTFVASANAIKYVGATPVFVDSEPYSWNMDPELLKEALHAQKTKGSLAKAVLVVDALGQTANYEEIQGICYEFDVPLIEDAAEALGATFKGKAAGTFGKAACLSFNGNKIITCGGGGMVLTDDEPLAKKVRHLATQACEPAPYYEHRTVGFNYRLSNLLAAVGRGQMHRLDEHIERRKKIKQVYHEGLNKLPGFSFMPTPPNSRSSHWLTVIQIDPHAAGTTVENVRLALKQANIEARPTWKPMHLQPVYSNYKMYGGTVSERIFQTGLCLPSGSNLTLDEQDRIVEIIRSTVQN